MFIIIRKKGEFFMIGDDIEIVVSKIEDGSVKIGIKVLKEILILRREIYEEVEKENWEVSKIDISMLNKIRKK